MAFVKRYIERLSRHWPTVVVTAELFFLAVYLLWRAGQDSAAPVTDFIYVNF